MIKRLFVAAILTVSIMVSSVALAEVLNFSGEGKAPITPNISETRAESLRLAKRAAIIAAVNKMNGPTASNDPKVQEAIEKIVVQIGDDKIADQTNAKDAANNFVTRLTIRMDDLEFRKLLQDQGIASTADRNFPILIVMDEFFSTPTDNNKPLRELVEYSHDKTDTAESSLAAAESSSSANSSSSKSAYDGAANYAGSRSSSGSVGGYGYDGGYSASGRQSASASGSSREKSANASDSSSQASASASLDAKSFDQKKDLVNYKKLIEYQPQNVGPSDKNLTYTAIVREAMKYDLRLLDNDKFRSKYFTGKPMTIQELQNSSELSRYVDAARDNKADYFMVGNTIIQNSGMKDGQYVCSGQVTIKAYSTEDGSILTADTRGETAIGINPDDCRGNVANKLAGFVGATVGSSIKDFTRQREVSGREFNIQLVSLLGNLTGRTTSSFSKAISSIKGINSKLNVRKSTNKEYEVSLTYKGDEPLSDLMGGAIDTVAALKSADWIVNGTTIKVCLEGKCP